MHADGNIRYANYQSEQEVIDYLTANGFGAETWNDWFDAPSTTSSLATEDAPAARPGLPQLVAENTALPGGLELGQIEMGGPDFGNWFHPAEEELMRAEFYG